MIVVYEIKNMYSGKLWFVLGLNTPEQRKRIEDNLGKNDRVQTIMSLSDILGGPVINELQTTQVRL